MTPDEMTEEIAYLRALVEELENGAGRLRFGDLKVGARFRFDPSLDAPGVWLKDGEGLASTVSEGPLMMADPHPGTPVLRVR